MKRGIISCILSSSILLSMAAMPTANAAERTAVFNDNFDDGDISGYSVYAPETGINPRLNAEDGGLKFNEDSGWNNLNGVKKDISSQLYEAGFKNGDIVYVSAEISSSWYDNPARLFIETGSEVIELESKGAGGQAWATVSLSGSTRIISGENRPIYICITQPCGTLSFDNIVVSYETSDEPLPTQTPEPTETPKPTGTPEPTPVPSPDPDAIVYDNFDDEWQTALYSGYDTANTDSVIGYDNGVLRYIAGNDWNSSNGIKRELTKDFEGIQSGTNFEVNLDMNAWWGAGMYENPASVFFEVEDSSGVITRTEIANAPEVGSEYNGDTVHINGMAKLRFAEGDRIYLCITQPSGNHTYDNITIKVISPYSEGIVQLTSGKIETGEFLPARSKSIYLDTFTDPQDIEKYSEYGTAFNDSPSAEGGTASFNFTSDWSTENGVKVDVTESMRSSYEGGSFKVTFDFLTYYWGGQGATAKLMYGKAGGPLKEYTVVSYTGADTGKFYTISGVVDELPGYNPATDNVFLCITQSAGGWMLDNVAIEIPYNTAKVYDMAVSDFAKLDEVTEVSVLYGDETIEDLPVEWEKPQENANVVYGVVGVTGLRAKAILADTAIKLKADNGKVTSEEIKLKYGVNAVADGDNQLVILVDNLSSLNPLSDVAVTGSYKRTAGHSETQRAMKISDKNGSVRIEGLIPEYANNTECIIITDKTGTVTELAEVLIDSMGEYGVTIEGLESGSYKAVMTSTGAKSEFSYADATAFRSLCDKIKSGASLAQLLENDDNRIVLGAEYYPVYDRLTEAAKANVCAQLSEVLKKSDTSRATASAYADQLIVMNSAASTLTAEEWKTLIYDNAATIGIKDFNPFIKLASAAMTTVDAAKNRLAGMNITEATYKNSFAGAVINAIITKAEHYSEVAEILKANADILNINSSAVTNNTAKYVMLNLTADMTELSAIAHLVSAAPATTTTGGGGSSGGGGGSSGSSSGGGGGSVAVGEVANVPPKAQPTATQEPQRIQGFVDLDSAGWAADAINALSLRGIINGYDDNTFRPLNNVTREEFVKLLITALEIDNHGMAEFNDVDTNRWSYGFIANAVNAGIVNGYPDGSFKPTENITREQMAVMLYRALQAKGIAPDPADGVFKDVISDYAVEAVNALAGAGIINGKGEGVFAPLQEATRAEAAAIIYRVIK